MEILPRTLFRYLAKELLRERRKQSVYNTYLYKAGVFQVGGTLTSEEREEQAVKQISEATLNFTGYSMTQNIKLQRPLKTLEGFYDLLAAVGRAFYLNKFIQNNGKLLQELKYEAGIALERPMKEFIIHLKDKTSIQNIT